MQDPVQAERMLAALGNGVKGNKWFSLIDKVYRPSTLQAAWQQVKANKGAAGTRRNHLRLLPMPDVPSLMPSQRL